ncbi:ricin-type beta-trefoil lectin domain protein [Streptomyces sp. NBC_01433]|uniref:RICIN domain-containing protein n=1 Tax=Streptomyces sp. NBC_01433 TaxID=2903864 RepID=UPI00224D14E5|nr:RICIN domain-containing protein [Streptomyces sp. NBC_01433]MCX4681857.1 ricin-type beta-trefoil lectin domain protein [Streptomyces sp. NBC_01433]
MACSVLAAPADIAAGAEPEARLVVIKSDYSGRCVFSPARNSGGLLHECNGGGSVETWEMTGPDTAATLRNALTGQCLTDYGPGAQATRTEDCNGGTGQEWNMPSTGQSGTIKNVYTGMCAEDDGFVEVNVCHGGAAEQWSVSKR